ncbi:MAG TPA: RodZ domain-containing protein [Steroidobacteraceae bacterium]|nr:RodZ domain-containing protein [Steroidobacteraceae bacterium]
MAAEEGGDAGYGIGSRLKAARERMGLTILQAAERVHTDAKVLEALEAEDFGALGAPVYVRGHLRHYAELVREPVAELQELYTNSTTGGQPDLTRIPKAQADEDSSKLVLPALLVFLVFAIVGAVGWVLSLSRHGPQPTQLHGDTHRGSPSAATDNEAAPTPAPNHGSVAEPKSARAASAAAASQAGASNPGPASAHAIIPRETQVTLRYAADSWTEVYDASGQKLFYDVGAASSVHTIKGVPPLRIVLGNAPGVTVEVDGKAARTTKMMRADGSAEFSINRAGRATPVAPAADGG